MWVFEFHRYKRMTQELEGLPAKGLGGFSNLAAATAEIAKRVSTPASN